jgi:hypothetical protein
MIGPTNMVQVDVTSDPSLLTLWRAFQTGGLIRTVLP